MPRLAQAALAGLAAAVLVLLGLGVLDATYLRHGADFTYAGYYPESTPPAAPAPPPGTPPAPGTVPRATHPGVSPAVPPAAPDGGTPAPPGDAGVPPPLPTATVHPADGGLDAGHPVLHPLRRFGGDGGASLSRLLRPGARADAGLRLPTIVPGASGSRPPPRALPPPLRAPPHGPPVVRPGGPPRPAPPPGTPPQPVVPPARTVSNAKPPTHAPTLPSPYDNVFLEQRVERTPQLYTGIRARARVLNAWDFRRLGPLLEQPKVLFRARARLELDRTSSWRFEVRGGGRGMLTIDGVPLVTTPQRTSIAIPLARGEHDFDLAWRIEDAGERVVTYAAAQGSPLRPLRPTDFRPPGGVEDAGRTRAWLLGLGTALAAALLVGWSLAASDRRARVRRGALTGALAVLLLGLGLRVWDYDVVPQYGQIGDELFVTWNGYSLLTEGKTRGWSLWPEQYAPLVQVSRTRFLGIDWNVVTPYFEHPPLMHVMVGGAALLGGAPHWLEARITHTRLVPIALSMVSLLLVMLLARKLDERPAVALVAGLLHAVLPSMVLQARLLKEDHLLTVLLAGSVLAVLHWTEQRRTRWLLLAAVLAGLSPLAKLPGVAAIAAVFCLAWAGGGLRAGLGTLAVSLPVASLVLVHGAVFGWSAFVRETLVQGTIRGGTWSLFVNWFEYARVGDNDIGRGWLLLLWFGFFTGFPRGRIPRAAYVLPVLLHMMATAFGSNWMYGWYMLPIFPFLCIGTARSIADAWSSADGWRPFVVAALGPMYVLQLMPPLSNVMLIKLVVTGVCLLAFTPLVVHLVVGSRATARAVRVVLAAGLVALTITAVAFDVTYDVTVRTAADFDASLRR